MNAVVDFTLYIRDQYRRCYDWIDAALEHSEGLATHESVLDGLLAGTMQIWADDKSVVITEIQNFGEKRVLRLFVIGGDLERALSKAPVIFGWAKRHMCCDMVRFDGRPGWEKIAARFGFKKVGIVMSAALKDIVKEN